MRPQHNNLSANDIELHQLGGYQKLHILGVCPITNMATLLEANQGPNCMGKGSIKLFIAT